MAPTAPLQLHYIERKVLGPHDIQVEILYCGVCHTDLHLARNDWNTSIYPIVPGHEIIGRVSKVGSMVSKFVKDDYAGIGFLYDSCRICSCCSSGNEQICEEGIIATFNSYERYTGNITYGGFSSQIVVDENYAVKIPAEMPLAQTAPLLCAGITTYSPLKYVGLSTGHKIAVSGLGGLGHMAVKFAVAMGAEVTVISTSPNKASDAREMGAHHFILLGQQDNGILPASHFDYIIDTVSGKRDYTLQLNMLKPEGTLIVVGLPSQDATFAPASLVFKRRKILGSFVGSITEMQEMINYCAINKIYSEVETIPIQQINVAFERMLKGDVRYRFVIDMSSLNNDQ